MPQKIRVGHTPFVHLESFLLMGLAPKISPSEKSLSLDHQLNYHLGQLIEQLRASIEGTAFAT